MPPIPTSNGAATVLRSALGTVVSALSTLAYFACSDGIRNYLLLMRKAGTTLWRMLS